MILDATIEHLRRYCAPFAGRVAGAADFKQGLENYNANMALPAAYVIPLDQDSEKNEVMTGLIQYVRKTIGITVELDARTDRRGQAPAMSYDQIEAALCRSMLNWRPPGLCTVNYQGYFLTGGRFLDLDRARLFYVWEFSLIVQLDDADGWDTGIDGEWLQGIEVDIWKAPPFAPLPPQVGSPPVDSPPAAIIVIPTAGPTLWDDTDTVWDDETTTWDEGVTNDLGN